MFETKKMNENLIPNIICELLENNNKIVIDGLGYFEVTHQAATYNIEKKILYPPMNCLYFKNDEAKADDIIAKKIAKKLNISIDKAFEKIELWVNDICMQLAESQIAAFGETGKFFIDKNNKIAFAFSDKTNTLKDNYGLKEVHLQK